MMYNTGAHSAIPKTVSEAGFRQAHAEKMEK
jgi:hypothetical protein